MRLLPQALHPDETNREALGELRGLGSLSQPRVLIAN